MGQHQIGIILKNNYPQYLSYREISEITQISWNSVLRCLRSMEKRNEIELKITPFKQNSGWKKLYRYKGGEKYE